MDKQLPQLNKNVKTVKSDKQITGPVKVVKNEKPVVHQHLGKLNIQNQLL